MKRSIVIGLYAFVFLAAACLAQEGSWRTEHYDSLLIAPGATKIKYVESEEGHPELTYIVEEPYPALNVVDAIREDLKRKGWEQNEPELLWRSAGSSEGKLSPPQRWLATWRNNNLDEVRYMLDYKDAEGEHYLRTLHVQATYIPSISQGNLRRSQTALAKPSTLRKVGGKLVRFGMPFLWFFSLLGPPLILTFMKARLTAFYRGPNEWLIRLNLFLFGSVLTPVLLIGIMLISVVFGKEGLLVTGLGGWVVMAQLARVGYIACAVVFLLAIGILRVEKIPKNVKITHVVLSAATFSFFVLCIHFFSGPLIRW